MVNPLVLADNHQYDVFGLANENTLMQQSLDAVSTVEIPSGTTPFRIPPTKTSVQSVIRLSSSLLVNPSCRSVHTPSVDSMSVDPECTAVQHHIASDTNRIDT